jgi:hypothetical protein
VTLEGRPPEPVGVGVRDLAPEALRRARIGALVNVDAEDHLIGRYPSHVQETQEEPDERWVAVNEADKLTRSARRCGLFLPPSHQ